MKNENFLTNFFKAVLAGLTISIGGITFLSIENSFIGSVMFAFGLLTIIYKGWNLYTGKVGYTTKLSLVPPLLVTLLGNLVGLSVGAAIYRVIGINETRLAAMAACLSFALALLLISFFAIRYTPERTVIGHR
jgi:formate/nitrite transporter FocA (FNT family)